MNSNLSNNPIRVYLIVYWLIFLLGFLFDPVTTRGQSNIKDSAISIPFIGVSYSYQIPAGDLVNNYGPNSNLGGSFLVKTSKNWIYGIDGSFLFGSNVKDTTVLDNIKTSQGQVIDQDGKYAEIFFYERGYSLSARGGKIFSFKKPNANSGIIFLSGIGFLQHKMRIEVTGNTVPELTSEYRKGYDRLSNGLALSQFLGYQYLGNSRLINFFGGIEMMAAFTKNRREYNYDTMEYDNKKRLDLLYGIRFGWILPLYKKLPKDFYFY